MDICVIMLVHADSIFDLKSGDVMNGIKEQVSQVSLSFQ